MRKIILPILFFLSIGAFAQSDFMLSQQYFSRINHNPAATGSSNFYNIYYMNRQQWVGFGDGSPSTNVLNAHTYFEKINSGIGLAFSYDKLGYANTSVDAKLAYAYYLKLGNDQLLSLGASAGVLYKSFDPSKLSFYDNNISVLPEASSETKPDVNIGAEYSTPFLLIGAAADHILNNDATSTQAGRSYYAYGRLNFAVGKSFDIAPMVTYMNVASTNFFEITALGFYKRMIWLGGGYRTNANALLGMVGVEYKMFRIGYGFEYNTGDLNDIAGTTHEIMLSLRINKGTKYDDNQRSVRFMD